MPPAPEQRSQGHDHEHETQHKLDRIERKVDWLIRLERQEREDTREILAKLSDLGSGGGKISEAELAKLVAKSTATLQRMQALGAPPPPAEPPAT